MGTERWQRGVSVQWADFRFIPFTGLLPWPWRDEFAENFNLNFHNNVYEWWEVERLKSMTSSWAPVCGNANRVNNFEATFLTANFAHEYVGYLKHFLFFYCRQFFNYVIGLKLDFTCRFYVNCSYFCPILCFLCIFQYFEDYTKILVVSPNSFW